MPKPHQPPGVPRRSSLQVGELADGRLLVRGPDGIRIASSVAREALGKGLGSTMVRSAEPVPPDPLAIDPRRLRVLGDGVLAERIAERLEVAASPIDGDLDALLEDRQLAVYVLERATYQTMFEVQEACLRLGVPSLYLTVDADGVRIGPSVVPGAGPCVACAQIVSFRALDLDAPELVAAVSSFRAGRLDVEHAERLAAAVAGEARALLALDGKPELLTSVRWLSAAGSVTYAVTPALDCPLCASAGETREHRLAAAAHRELVERHRHAPRIATTAETGDQCTAIGILGGGTAGYLTAMALGRWHPDLAVTLIESSAVPVIGVGEATTPLMPQFLHVDLGLDVHELFRQVAPTFKLGIRFEWGAPGGVFNYPFGPIHVLEPAAYDGDIRRCSPRSLLIDAGALPLARDRRGWHSDLDLGVDVAYHLDNQRFVRYLRNQAKDFGVEIVDAKISGVEVADDGGSVIGLVADDGRRFAFDLYVDCSGFRSLLLEETLGSPFLSYQDSLLTDRALVASVPHAKGESIRPYTLAQSYGAGWCWSTPQRDADHRGYVFCSELASPEDAEREMRRVNPGMGDARLITFRAGRHQHFWRGNVVAMGNAYGFVEPLESTALHMLIRQIGLLAGAFPLRPNEPGVAAVLSRKVGAWWDYLRWFLALHYRYNRYLDTPFWRRCRRHTDVSSHRELIELFRERGPLSYQPATLAGVDVPDPLWGAEGVDLLLLGQGVESLLPAPALSRAQWRQRARLYQQAAARSTPQRQAFEILDRQPELLERWVAGFERLGPAFGGRRT